MRRAALLTLATGLALGAASARSESRPAVLLGADYSHVAFPRCDLSGTGIVQYGFEETVRLQLQAMHAAGLRSLRLLLWHQTEIYDATWGMVPSAGGRLAEPYRTHLASFLDAVRRTGFRRLTVSLGPMGTNHPVGYPTDYWRPELLEENWAFLADVRALVKEHGPTETRLDIENEVPPASWMPVERVARIESYVAEMYRRYLDAYGGGDISFSVIAKGPENAADRLSHLIGTLRRSGLPLPSWIDLHPSYGAEALQDLRAAERVLDENGWHPEIVLGEAGYERRDGADAIAQFARESALPVTEVDPWPRRREPCEPGLANSVSPPFRDDAYFRALTGRPAPSTLRADVGGNRARLITPSGDIVTALPSGRWVVVVRDRSAHAGFTLRGPNVHLETGLSFRGTRTFRVDLRAGTYRYGRSSFIVLRSPAP